ncbi:MAG: PD-(D/E)XK nuclease family protein [Pseudomonadota bacterium]
MQHSRAQVQNINKQEANRQFRVSKVTDLSQFSDDAARVLWLTVNQRLSREIVRRYDASQVSDGARAWKSIEALSWQTGLRWMFDLVRESTGESMRLLHDAQALAVWENIVAESGNAADLLDTRALAREAQRAWSLHLEWRIDIAAPQTREQAAFVTWAKSYRAQCQQHRWIDTANLTDWLINRVSNIVEILKRRSLDEIHLLGFDQLSPAQIEWQSALNEADVSVLNHAVHAPKSNHACLLELPDSAVELRSAANWARSRLTANPQQRLGIVLPDLAQRRDALIEMLDETFNPAGALQAQPPQSPVYNVSLGESLATQAMIRDALDCLSLAHRAQPVQQATRLLISPHLGEALSERHARARFERDLRREIYSDVLSLDELARRVTLRATLVPALASRMEQFTHCVTGMPPRATLANWVRYFADLLDSVGWPGQGALNSREFQLHASWQDVLIGLRSRDVMGVEMRFGEALRALRTAAQESIFQIETNDSAPLQVTGLLESVGMQFDALWVAGMDENTWPATAQLTPFLHVNTQRKKNVPHCSAEWEYAFAQRTLAQLHSSACELVFSFAQQQGENLVAVSPLISDLPRGTLNADDWVSGAIENQHAQTIALEAIDDSMAPEWQTSETLRGGVAVLSDQAECPFRAFASHRLAAKTLEEWSTGVNAAVRGSLLHKALETLWRELQSQTTLLSLDHAQLDDKICAAVDQAIRLAHLPGRDPFISLERAHLRALIKTWLELEKERTPFVVESLEQAHAYSAGDLILNLQVDRTDVLEEGARVLIDYKTGQPKFQSENWNKERPGDLQLPIYALADRENVDAVTLAFVRSQQPKFKGIGEDGIGIKGIEPVRKKFKKLDVETWNDVKTFWRESIESLAHEFASGHSQVVPRKRTETCAFCPFDVLCRISDSDTESNDAREDN